MLDEARKFAERVWGPLESCPDLRERERVERELEDWAAELIDEQGQVKEVERLEKELADESDNTRLEDKVSDLESRIEDLESERDELATQLEELRASHAEDDRGEVA